MGSRRFRFIQSAVENLYGSVDCSVKRATSVMVTLILWFVAYVLHAV